MKNLIPCIFLAALMTSCATILKKKTYDLRVETNLANAQVRTADSLYPLPNNIEVTRSDKDLELTLLSDTLELEYTVKSSLNPTFLYWNLTAAQFSPVNYAIDFTNKKRFYYGKTVNLHSNDTLRIIEPPVRKFWRDYFSKKYPTYKNHLNLFLSIPYINGFMFKPKGQGPKVSTGFWGIAAGLEYFYKDNKYFSLKYVAATNFAVPVPAPVTLPDVIKRLNTTYIELSDNYKLKRLNLGYGLNYSANHYGFIDESDTSNIINIARKNQSFGFTYSIYYQFGNTFFLGLIYRPTLFRIKPTIDLKYEHLISIDLAFKIPLIKK